MTRDERETMRDTFKAVAVQHGLSEADLYIRDRARNKVLARREAWVKCRRQGFTFEAIAALGGWHYTSIMHGVANYE